jgi:organic radical activating enzyme
MQGSTNSCHRVKSDTIAVNDYQNFHNTPTKLKHRDKMLNGIWPGDGCEYCKKIEDAGGRSDRLELNEDVHYAPKELKFNNYATAVTPRILEVYFNNLCNLNCIYCNSDYSTVWEAEDRKFNLRSSLELDQLSKGREQYPDMLKNHWKWMEENAKNLIEYRILGGEPFFQPELKDNIEFFKKNPCPDTKFVVFSNLKIENSKMCSLLDEIVKLEKNNHIKSFSLVCSLDCWGPQQEYIRTGLNLKQWEENFLTILKNYQSVNLEIHGTIISLTLDTLPSLCKKVTEWNKVRKVKHSISFVSGCQNMDANIFPNNFFDLKFDNAINESTDKNIIEWLKGFKKTVNNAPCNNDAIRKLKHILNNFDIRRGTNWKILWPWLDKYEV